MRLTSNKIIATGLMSLGLSLSVLALNLHAEDAAPAAAAPTAAPAADAKPAGDKTAVATVNGQVITKETLDSLVGMIKATSPDTKVDTKSLLDDLIITELARQEANKSDLANSPDVKEKVKNFTDKLVLDAWAKDKAASFKISDADLKAAYDKQVAAGDKSEYKARHILMKTKEEAAGIIKDLEKGTDFADLAKKSSDGPSAAQGGDLGWFKPASMVKPFADAVAKMEKGTYTKEPVQTEFGWHVIKLEDKRDVKPPEFEALKPQLQCQMEQEKMMAYMQDLRTKADVKVTLPEEKADAAKPDAAAKPEEKK